MAQVIPKLYKNTKGYGTQAQGGQVVLLAQGDPGKLVLDNLQKPGEKQDASWMQRMKLVIGQTQNSLNGSQLQHILVNIGSLNG